MVPEEGDTDSDSSLIKITITLVVELVEKSLGDWLNFQSFLVNVSRILQMIVEYWGQLSDVRVATVAVDFDNTTPQNDSESWCTGEEKVYTDIENDVDILQVYNESGVLVGWELKAKDTDITYEENDVTSDIHIEGIANTYDNSTGYLITGKIWVCDRPAAISSQCLKIKLEPDEYDILPNRSLSYHEQLYNVSEYMLGPNATAFICNPFPISPNTRYLQNPKLVRAEGILSVSLLSVSLLAMVLTLVTYTIFPKLRNLPRVCIMNLAASLLAAELLFLIGVEEKYSHWLCFCMSVSLHYLFLCSFAWMNVLAYDLFMTFHATVHEVRDKKKHFPRYAVYAYGVPAAIVLTTCVASYVEVIPIAAEYANRKTCWITNSTASIFFFGIPILLVLISNAFFYIRTVWKIHRTLKLMKELTSLDVQVVVPNTRRKDLSIYIRMSTVMGFTWLFGFTGAMFYSSSPGAWHVFNILFIIFNALQGTMIFFAFICNRRILEQYR